MTTYTEEKKGYELNCNVKLSIPHDWKKVVTKYHSSWMMENLDCDPMKWEMIDIFVIVVIQT